MTEKLLQFIWQFQYFNASSLQSAAGEAVQVLYPGAINHHQGPDFRDARIRIGNTTLVGSVELHLKTSQWLQHKHQYDPLYNNVVLHVVFEHDQDNINAVPVLELQPRIPKLLLDRYTLLMQEAAFIPCAATIAETRPITITAWKERLVAERLTRKAQYILSLLAGAANHWEQVFWQLLARNFGIKVNADAFEQIAQSIPVTILAKQKSSIHQLEALLMGQAGLLQQEFKDPYCLLLQREYAFLKHKYNLKPISTPLYYLRMRPSNFPTVRLAQLAMLVHQSEHLFSKVLEAEDIQSIKQWLNVTANDYWHYHYRLEEPSSFKPKHVGTDMIQNIVINTIVPIVFAYGLYHNKGAYTTKALQWLEALSAERNSITNNFEKLKLENRSAFDSQALLELKNEYCNYRRCLECSVGNATLKRFLSH